MSGHYAHVMLAEILPLNLQYHPNESPKLKTQLEITFVLLLKVTNDNMEILKWVKQLISIVCQQFRIEA